MEENLNTLEFVRDGKLIIVTLSNGNKLNYIIDSWVKSKGKIDETIFAVFNGFINTFSSENRVLLDSFYIDSYNILNELKLNIRELDDKLYHLNDLYFSLFDWYKLREYVIQNCNMGPSVKTEIEPEYDERTTYLTDHYIDLLTFSILIKGLMPIWGLYYVVTEKQLAASTTSVVKNEHVFMSALELMKVPSVLNNPAFLKLELYIRTHLSNKDVNGFTIINDISSEDIGNYILAIALWKKIILFSGLGIHSIVNNLVHICKEKTKGMLLNKPKEKKDKNSKQSVDDDKNNTIGDMFRMTTTHPPALITGIEYYIETEFTTQYGFKAVFNRLNGVLLKRTYTTTILSIMYKYAIHINLLECIEYSKLLTLIAHAHLTLKSDVRFPTIAQLLISNGTDKDIRVYDLGLKSTLPLTREHLVLLGTVYHQQLVHVAVNGINNIAKEVMLYDWNFDISNLKIELVNLIIEYNK